MIELMLSTYLLLNLIILFNYIYKFKGVVNKGVIGDVLLRLIFGCFLFTADLINKK